MDARPERDPHKRGDWADLRAFFGPRASGWEQRFPDDGPAYERAAAELGAAPGGLAVDAGCGTGRALPALRAAVGTRGRVVAIDATPQMLAEAVRAGRSAMAGLVLGDVCRMPLPDRCAQRILAAGLLPHLPDPGAGLSELARVAAPGARLAIFHPVGRAALAARHQRALSDDDVLAERPLATLLARSGWVLQHRDDAEDRFLVLAIRAPDLDDGGTAG